MVDAGRPNQLPSADITYATPIQWIIDDLQERYHSATLL